MGMFAQDPGVNTEPQGRYQGITKERGTRNLILWFVGVVAVWLVIGRIQDHFLLQAKWGDLTAQPEGLTVVGTLDSKDYDRNLFRIVTANQTSRVELTDYGWNSIFDERNGPLFRQPIGDEIRAVAAHDNDTSYRMLEPYLKAILSRQLGHADWTTMVQDSTPITIDIVEGKSSRKESTTLGALLAKFSSTSDTKESKDEPTEKDGGSASGRKVEHGLAIPPDSLLSTCPIVLTGDCFDGADLDTNPATMFDGKTFTVRLHLKPEGRSRFFQWSSRHENENLVFVLKHRVAVAARIKQAMDVNFYEIGPLHDEEMAKALVNYVASKH